MKEISEEFNQIMPSNDGKPTLPSFFEKPSFWFFIKLKLKQLFNR